MTSANQTDQAAPKSTQRVALGAVSHRHVGVFVTGRETAHSLKYITKFMGFAPRGRVMDSKSPPTSRWTDNAVVIKGL